jgi:iron-sulfur cluster assembly accessory protein
MFDFTEKAAKEMFRQDAGRGQWIRLFVIGGGCQGFKYCVAWMEPMLMMSNSAHLYEKFGVNVYIDERSYEFLDQTTLDYDPFKGFIFNNPKAISSCGCGGSVTF